MNKCGAGIPSQLRDSVSQAVARLLLVHYNTAGKLPGPMPCQKPALSCARRRL